MSAISIKAVDFYYDKIKVLENLNVEILPHSLIGIVGPNGGGKSTLLNLIMGFLKPQKGSITVFGNPASSMQQHIGYVPQTSRFDPLFPITVLEVVLLGKRNSHKNIDCLKKAHDLLDRLGLLCKKDENFFSLSGGQAQRVLIARALMSSPQILVLDEPTSNIDRENEKILFNLLKNLKNETTILMVSHSLKTLTEEIDGALLVNKNVCYLKPEELCQHYSLGLYHPPIKIHRP